MGIVVVLEHRKSGPLLWVKFEMFVRHLSGGVNQHLDKKACSFKKISGLEIELESR